MTISEIKFKQSIKARHNPEYKVLSVVSILIDGYLRIKDIALVEYGDGGKVLLFPMQINRHGFKYHTVYPISKEAYRHIFGAIWKAWKEQNESAAD